jgi:uncharacterized membrane protein
VERTSRALVAGAGASAGLAGAVATMARRRNGPTQPEHRTLGITVSGPAEQVHKVWASLGASTPIEVAPAPGDRGVEVRVQVPADRGRLGVTDMVDRVRGETPEQQAREHLRLLRSTVETGDVVTTEGQPSGRGPVAAKVTAAVSRRLRNWGVL